MTFLTLFAPGLFAGLPEQTNGVLDPARWPALSTLCARANVRTLDYSDAAQSLIGVFGLPIDESTQTTIATLSASIDNPPLDRGDLMRADPVHLRVDPNQMLLFNDPGIMPSAAEADALLECLNRGFDDLRFSRGRHPGRWYFQCAQRPLTHSPQAVSGRSVASYMPEGAGSDRLKQVMNDAQMLLHDHAVNRARDARGVPPINAVWPWGANVLCNAKAAPPEFIIGDDVLTAALAAAHSLDWRAHAVPKEVLAEIARHKRRGLVVLGSPTGAMEAQGVLSVIDSVEQHWAGLILTALRRFELKRALLVTDREIYSVGPFDLIKIWRRRQRIFEAAS